MTRRLLNYQQVSEKLGYAHDWLRRTENRKALENRGFPPPITLTNMPEGRTHGAILRWDEKAIDLWLDLQMPAHLRDGKPKFSRPEISMIDLAGKLAGRAKELQV